MKAGGTVLIDRENSRSARAAMEPLVDVLLKEGRSVCIAPEGTRSTSTNLGRFKKGAFHLAMQAGVPIVPVVIHNAIDVAARGESVLRPATVKVTVLPAIDTSQWTFQTINDHVSDVRDLFLDELDQAEYQNREAPELREVKSPRRKPKKNKARANVVKLASGAAKSLANRTGAAAKRSRKANQATDDTSRNLTNADVKSVAEKPVKRATAKRKAGAKSKANAHKNEVGKGKARKPNAAKVQAGKKEPRKVKLVEAKRAPRRRAKKSTTPKVSAKALNQKTVDKKALKRN